MFFIVPAYLNATLAQSIFQNVVTEMFGGLMSQASPLFSVLLRGMHVQMQNLLNALHFLNVVHVDSDVTIVDTED